MATRRAFGSRGFSSAIQKLPEVISASTFPSRLNAAIKAAAPSKADIATLTADPHTTSVILRAAMATTQLHTQSRIAAFEGHGFYTIGPCGEELLSALALALRPTDPMALHYRHLGVNIARQVAILTTT